MNPFDPEVQALAWTLIHFLWQGCGVWAVAALALRALRGSRPGARYAVGILALVACVAIPVGTYARLHPAAMAREVEGVVIAKAEHPESAPSPTAREGSPIRGHHVPMLHVEPKAWLPWVVRLWFFGSLLLALRLGGGWMGLRSLRRDGKPASEEWQRRLERLGRAMRIGRVPILRLSTSIKSPLVAGWIRPMLLMPAGLLTGLDPAAVEALLAHELAHIRRQDYLVNLMQCAVEILLFYHPAVWWISARVRTERELCCDDAAVAWCRDPQLYAETLNELRAFQARSLAPALAAGGGDLMFRIKRLLASEVGGSGRARSSRLSALVCSMIVLGCAAYSTRALLAQSSSSVITQSEWFLAGSNRKDYHFETDPSALRDNLPSILLTTGKKDVEGFGTVMQTRDASPYLGKRVRLSAWVRNEQVEDWAGLWMRVDGQNTDCLAFDNMGQRPIKGTLSWTRYEVVLNVAPEAKKLAFGLLLGGPGKVWMNDVRLEVVDASVAVTDTAGGPPSLSQGALAPEAWFMAGSHPRDYITSLDSSASYEGKPTHLLACTSEKPKGFGTIMQAFRGKDYLGKRIRLSAWVKSENVADWAGVWMRIDGAEKPLAFDNMEKRAIKGNTDWHRCEVVLDVAPESRGIALGILLAGKGNVWMTEPTLEIVDASVPSTNTMK